MEVKLLDPINLCWPSAFVMPTTCSMKCLREHKRHLNTQILVPKAATKKVENSRHGLQKSSNKNLAHILRTEAAIINVEKKADSRKYTRLWPKAVLEALDDAIRQKRWQSALKVNSISCFIVCRAFSYSVIYIFRPF